jgi:hypothetical protein
VEGGRFVTMNVTNTKVNGANPAGKGRSGNGAGRLRLETPLGNDVEHSPVNDAWKRRFLNVVQTSARSVVSRHPLNGVFKRRFQAAFRRRFQAQFPGAFSQRVSPSASSRRPLCR